jgi:hypothetical protein
MLSTRVRDPRVLMLTGMLCLAVAGFSLNHSWRIAGMGAERMDLIPGILFGIAIGFCLWSVWLSGRRRRLGRS